MTTNQESGALGLVIDRHRSGGSENDIRTAFQRFIETAGIATLGDMETEVQPGVDGTGRMDLYLHNTCIEFKTHILRNGVVVPGHISQLDGYLVQLLKAGTGVQNGILTDGVHYLIRRLGDDKLPRQQGEPFRVFSRPEQAPHLREYLHGVIAAPAANIKPTAENLERHFGSGSDVFRAGNLLLNEAYDAHRDHPTVAVKRRLWQDLLQVALGRDAATAGDESDWLFIRHTYVTSLVAAIMHQLLLGDVTRHAADRPDDLLKGRILAEQSDLHGVIDADLFTWPTEVGEGMYLREIAKTVDRFDWQANPREVAPTLYQHVITQEERKQLGEYYTPRWLAQEITRAVVDDPLNQRVLDPSCGSGTFIETAVEHLLEHADDLTPAETLQKLQQNIIGIDIHPVAVQLAKATWVMTAADTIRAARRQTSHTGAAAAPIYLGDSLQLRYNTGTLFASDAIELETGETLPGRSGTVTFSIPKELARHQSDMDRLISELATAIDEDRDTVRVADTYEMSDDCRWQVEAVADAMRALHAAGRNHVWAYYIRNMIRPAVIAEEKADRIIGNPPWLTYSNSADIVRQELRGMSRERYQIWAGGKQAPHQDIAALFYTRCAELYAGVNAVMGMVMPHSVLRTGQHLRWRGGTYRRKGGGRSASGLGLDLRVREPWDLDHVEPDLFPMPASVVFARYVGFLQGTPLAPGTVQVWRGNWQAGLSGISRSREALHHDDGRFRSPYAARSSQGPSIVDRRLFFVETMPHRASIPTADTTNVRPRRGNKDKVRYEGRLEELEGVVHNDHLFNVYLGECIAPYTSLSPLRAALPVHRPMMTMPLNHDDCEDGKHDACRLDVEALHPTMQRRWNKAANMYREAHRQQAVKELYDRLNHQKILSGQLAYLRDPGESEVRLAYTSSGEPTASLIHDRTAIVDYTLFWVVCWSKVEAYYLLAVLNSRTLKEQAGQFMPKGLFGARHFQKHGWKLPIPAFDERDPLHARLSGLGEAAEAECAHSLPTATSWTNPLVSPSPMPPGVCCATLGSLAARLPKTSRLP